MDYEKKYNEALAWMREMYPCLTDSLREDAEHYFPELRESEDERIRKAIITHLSNELHNIKQLTPYTNEFEDWISYLEKQKDSNDMTFHEGYTLGFEDGMKSVEQKEQKPNVEICPHSIKSKSYSVTGYPIEDCDYGLEIALDILEKTLGKVQGFQTDDGIREHQTAIKAVKDAMEEQKPADDDPLDDPKFLKGFDTGREVQRIFDEQKPVDFPATDEEVKEFLETHPKVEVPEKYETPDFVFSKQEYESHSIISKDTTSVKPAEWSEEDEKNLELVIDCVYEFYPDPVIKYKLKDWLNSFRSRPKSSDNWKPSEEQMDAIDRCVDYLEESDNEDAEIMESLQEQLHKLM